MSVPSHILSAIFSDDTPFYRSPSEPDPGDSVTIRLRVARGSALRVVLLLESLEVGTLMVKTRSDAFFDFYEAGIVCDHTRVLYRFLIEGRSGLRIAYDRNGCRVTEDGSMPDFNPAYAFRFLYAKDMRNQN